MTILWFTDSSQAMWGFLFFSLEVWMFTTVANLEKILFWALVCFQNSLYILLLLILMWDSKISHNTQEWLYLVVAFISFCRKHFDNFVSSLYVLLAGICKLRRKWDARGLNKSLHLSSNKEINTINHQTNHDPSINSFTNSLNISEFTIGKIQNIKQNAPSL